MVVVDSTFLIALEREENEAQRILGDLEAGTETIRVPGAIWTEYLSGFPPEGRDTARETLEAGTRFEPFTRRLADEAARLQHELMRSGQALGWHNLQAATAALHYDEALVSTDDRFAAVPGLDLREH